MVATVMVIPLSPQLHVCQENFVLRVERLLDNELVRPREREGMPKGIIQPGRDADRKCKIKPMNRHIFRTEAFQVATPLRVSS